ncbi:MAG: gfo/Idh/MocA family oxidoreductase, partial [Planctomycetota bacterium]
SRIPAGHPEAYIEAFANVYRGARQSILGQGTTSDTPIDYPTIADGARGVHFIEKTVESAKSDKKWTTL